jgi:PAP2 superfamily
VPPVTWPLIAVAYFGLLTVLAWSAPRFAAARFTATGALALTALLVWAAAAGVIAAAPLWLQALLPVPILLLGYTISGHFYLAPMPRAEAWLTGVDRRLLGDTSLLDTLRRAPAVASVLEVAYLLVHPMIPAGALIVAASGSAASLDRYWATVMLAGLSSYVVLPWLQTRPPRQLERAGGGAPSALRGINLAILRHASTGVNTIPSGHAACAVAAWLGVASVAPVAAPLFLALAVGICAAAVLGRYHFTVDVALGALVAVSSWLVLVH